MGGLLWLRFECCTHVSATRWRVNGPGAALSLALSSPKTAPPAAHAARLIGLIRVDEASALVGEADDGIGIVGFLVGLEGLKHRVRLARLGAQPRAQAHARQL